MSRRIVHIRKAKMIESYSIGEYVGKEDIWKQQEIFDGLEEVIDYLANSNEKYALELRKRRNLGVVIDVQNNEGEALFQALNGIKSSFKKVFIKKGSSDNH